MPENKQCANGKRLVTERKEMDSYLLVLSYGSLLRSPGAFVTIGSKTEISRD